MSEKDDKKVQIAISDGDEKSVSGGWGSPSRNTGDPKTTIDSNGISQATYGLHGIDWQPKTVGADKYYYTDPSGFRKSVTQEDAENIVRDSRI
ncbi:MAG: hypothetical protein LBJ95_05020 [Oscillospiraceae bacterium]|nr:hypothetical protein [Oscillospiraceae bacterium]